MLDFPLEGNIPIIPPLYPHYIPIKISFIYLSWWHSHYILIITLWQFNIAIEHGPCMVDLPIKNGHFPELC